MASDKKNWILCVAALVSCVLISTVAGIPIPADGVTEDAPASENTAIQGLISALNGKEPADVESMLNSYENKDDKIDTLVQVPDSEALEGGEYKTFAFTVGELANLCQESVENCSYDRFLSITHTGWLYRDSVPELHKYGHYCRHTKLNNYCRNHIDSVVSNLAGKIPWEDTYKMNSFAGALGTSVIDAVEKAEKDYSEWLEKNQALLADKTSTPRQKYNDGLSKKDIASRQQLSRDIRAAYSKYMKQELEGKPEGLSLDAEANFFRDFKDSIKKYAHIYNLFRELNAYSETAPEMKSPIDLVRFGRVASQFIKSETKLITRDLNKRGKGLPPLHPGETPEIENLN